MAVTKFLTWPIGLEAEAAAYKAQADIENNLISGEVDGIFTELHLDRHGQTFCAALMPPYSWDGINEIPEPSSLVPLRVNAVLHDTPEWPDSEPEE